MQVRSLECERLAQIVSPLPCRKLCGRPHQLDVSRHVAIFDDNTLIIGDMRVGQRLRTTCMTAKQTASPSSRALSFA
jgi:hypothetical protein